MSARDPARLSAAHVWETVLDCLGNLSGLAVLDAPCGGGAFSREMEKRGAKVVSLDLFAASSEGTPIVRADLNKALPFPSSHFDRAVCIEGVEHIENPAFLLRELARVIKPGGRLIMTTPNTQNIRSRIKFLLTGIPFWFGGAAAERYGHISPLSVWQMERFAQKAGFGNLRFRVNRLLGGSRLLSPIFRILGGLSGERYNESVHLAGEILVVEMVRNA